MDYESPKHDSSLILIASSDRILKRRSINDAVLGACVEAAFTLQKVRWKVSIIRILMEEQKKIVIFWKRLDTILTIFFSWGGGGLIEGPLPLSTYESSPMLRVNEKERL